MEKGKQGGRQWRKPPDSRDKGEVLRGISELLNLGNLNTKEPTSEQQANALGISWDACKDNTIKLFGEKVQTLIEKMPLACRHSRQGSSIKLSTAKENGCTTSRPRLPVLPNTEFKPSKTDNERQTLTPSMATAVEEAQLQQGSNSLKEAMWRLTMANWELREAMYACEEGRIEGYPDLEIASIDAFAHAIDIDRAMKALGRLAGADCVDVLCPQPKDRSEQQKDPDLTGSTTSKNDKKAGGTAAQEQFQKNQKAKSGASSRDTSEETMVRAAAALAEILFTIKAVARAHSNVTLKMKDSGGQEQNQRRRPEGLQAPPNSTSVSRRQPTVTHPLDLMALAPEAPPGKSPSSPPTVPAPRRRRPEGLQAAPQQYQRQVGAAQKNPKQFPSNTGPRQAPIFGAPAHRE